MIEFLKSVHGKLMVAVTIIAAFTIYLTFNFFINLSSFAVAVTKAIISLILFWLFDRYGMNQIDTVEELKKGNTSYAIFMLALAVIIAAAIIGS
ncbi:MAG: hypothetical protein P4L45_06730 [Ignavibacteriaceae bacterium]|nr:hypothetical protein [Ignavibacteriaceae bacterium]